MGGGRGILQTQQQGKIIHLPSAHGARDGMLGILPQLPWLYSPPARKIMATPAGTCTEQQQVTLATKSIPPLPQLALSLYVALQLGS